MKSKPKQDLNRWLRYWAFWLIPIWVSCQSQPHLALDAVGPPFSGASSSSLDFTGIGFLKVYSATETREVGKFINYYPHTPYTIYTTNGNVLRSVANSVAITDENPVSVQLPAGFYTIAAQDDDYGRVMVPVVIKGGQTTTVHLETRASSRSEALDATNSVRLPNGRMVGWRATARPE